MQITQALLDAVQLQSLCDDSPVQALLRAGLGPDSTIVLAVGDSVVPGTYFNYQFAHNMVSKFGRTADKPAYYNLDTSNELGGLVLVGGEQVIHSCLQGLAEQVCPLATNAFSCPFGAHHQTANTHAISCICSFSRLMAKPRPTRWRPSTECGARRTLLGIGRPIGTRVTVQTRNYFMRTCRWGPAGRAGAGASTDSAGAAQERPRRVRLQRLAPHAAKSLQDVEAGM